jgi:hypothetical protein
LTLDAQQDNVYTDMAERHPDAAVVVPPRTTAVASETAETAPTQRDHHLPHIAEDGRMSRQRASGYARRALAEIAIARTMSAPLTPSGVRVAAPTCLISAPRWRTTAMAGRALPYGNADQLSDAVPMPLGAGRSVQDIAFAGGSGSAGSGMNSSWSAFGSFIRPARQSALACSIRSREEETNGGGRGHRDGAVVAERPALPAPGRRALGRQPRNTLPPPVLCRLYVARDNDDAGQWATDRLTRRMAQVGVEVAVLVPRLRDFNELL